MNRTVTLPEGVYPGQKIEVRSPDGTQTVDTVVPNGVKPGDAFLVRFPPQTRTESRNDPPVLRAEPIDTTKTHMLGHGNFARALDDFLTPKPDFPMPQESSMAMSQKDYSTATPRTAHYSSGGMEYTDSPSQRSREFSEAYQAPPSPYRRPEAYDNRAPSSPRNKEPAPRPPSINGQDSRDSSTGPVMLNKPTAPKKYQLFSTPIRKVEGSPINATITPAQVEETRQEPDHYGINEQDEDTGSQYEDAKEDMKASSKEATDSSKNNTDGKTNNSSPLLNLAKSLEEFLTPTPDIPPNSLPKDAEDNQDQEKGDDLKVMQMQSRGREAPSSPKGPSPKPRDQSPSKYREPRSSSGYGAARQTVTRPSPIRPGRINQKLVEVQVPPGMPAGATIYVELPGENRTLAAQVPPNVTSFHVAYTPRYEQQVPTPAHAEPVSRPQAGREKLLSVRVPPGTLPGTTLHVSVPDEPGRILAAKVPPGNVRKFHVSYIPSERTSVPKGGMLPPANAYRGRTDRYQERDGIMAPSGLDHYRSGRNDIEEYNDSGMETPSGGYRHRHYNY